MQAKAPRRIVLASANPGKLEELQSLLQPWGCEALPQSRFRVPAVQEDADNFAGNALLKAHAAARYSGLPAIADDSGLEVDALHGAPGVRSARYAGEDASDGDNNARLLAELRNIDDTRRVARYHCALVYLRHWQDPNPMICQASWEGSILQAPRGEHGFGYDPLFLVAGQNRSAAEMPPREKNLISHRGQAMRLLSACWQREYS